jgi:hypothetical protein
MSQSARSVLPSPADYLRAVGADPTECEDGWILAYCPLHCTDTVTRPLRISPDDGRFRCAMCGASGKDVIALHALAIGRSRVEAQLDLTRCSDE